MTTGRGHPAGGGCSEVGTAPAEWVLHRMLTLLPHDHLVCRPPAVATPAVVARDERWMREQIRLRGLIWGVDDPFVLGTLWWYSASSWLVMPTVTSWFVTGRALSARLEDVRLFHRPDSRILGSVSLSLGPTDVSEVGAQLRVALGPVIEVLAAVIGRGERRLWSFVVDAIAGRLLWAAEHMGREGEVAGAASLLVAAVGEELPRPRLTEVRPATRTSTTAGADVGAAPPRLHVRRGSCCLLYQVPHEVKCADCPRQTPQRRLQRLGGRPLC